MSKPKYIILVTLSLLFYVAWLTGLYVSLGLSGFSTERRMWLFIPSLLCLIPSWFIDRRLKMEERYKFKTQVIRNGTSKQLIALNGKRIDGEMCSINALGSLFLVRQLQQVISLYAGA